MAEKFGGLRLDGNQLKLVAAFSMLVDHLGLSMVGFGILSCLPTGSAEFEKWYFVYCVVRTIGRMAFPVFAYLLVEGYIHTRDWKKYAVRLGCFAVLSEVPFDLFLTGHVVEWEMQNVVFTLLLGLLMMKALDAASSGQMALKPELSSVMQFIIVGAVCLLAYGIRSDYDFAGIILIAIFYLFRGNQKKQCGTGLLWCLLAFSRWYFIFGLAPAFYLLYLYNGRRGKSGCKYGGYIFYPAHLAVLAFVSRLLFGGR